MNAIALAAGGGRRLAPLGWDKPKCLLPFGDETLLARIAAAARDASVTRLTLVVGYRRELVEAALTDCPTPVELLVNEDYSATNTIYSLWLARQRLDDDTLFFNADVLFDRRIIPRLIAEPNSALAVEVGRCGDEEVKVTADSDSRVRRIGKDLPPDRSLGEFIGIAKFAAAAGPALRDSLEHHVEALGQKKLFFEAAIDPLLDRHPFLAVPLDDLRAIEIDTPDDLARARDLWQSGVLA